MSLIKQPLRYAHSEGLTDMCYEADTGHILTCGIDGDVRVWKGLDDDDPESFRVGEKVFSVACGGGRFFTASDDNAIQMHTFPEGNPDGIATRFTAPVTHMCVSNDNNTLVAGSSDFTVKVVDVEMSSHKILQGHEAPVLGVAFDPQQEFVVSSSCDGTLKIWKLADQNCVKSLQLFPKSNDISISKVLCRSAWQPKKGKYLAVPAEKEIQVYERDNWNLAFSLTDDCIKENVSLVSFSPCGRFLAAAAMDGIVTVWDFTKRKLLLSEQHERKLTITALAWNPKVRGQLAYCDMHGQLGAFDNVIPEGLLDEKETASTASNQFADLFDDDDDDALIQATNDNIAPAQAAADSDDDDDIGTQRKKVLQLLEEDENSMDVNDADSNFGEKNDDGNQEPQDNEDKDSVVSSLPPVRPIYTEGYKPTPLQRPFQPASSPVHLSQRFMVWNAVGIIRQYNTEEENTIDIEFHDTATHHALHINNTLNHTMADLSSEAVLLASQSDEEANSLLVCMHFASWDNSKEWRVELPAGEDIMAVTVGTGWVAAATSKRHVRLFTISGIQQEIFSIPGPVVSMAAHSNQLMVIYHKGQGVPGDQCLGVRLLHVKGKRKCTINGENLPISGKSTLSWIGFSAEGTPITVDSTGAVRMLNRKFGYSWIQMANLKEHVKGKSDNYWVIGVNENPQQLRCIFCKGSTYPPTLPRPQVMLLPFQIPLCEISADKGQLEESYWRTNTFGSHFDFWSSQGYLVEESDKKQATMGMQESLMKLFALACKTEHEYRAVELCEMMANQHTVQLAIKYASRMRLMQLAQRISEVARQKAEEEARLQGAEDEEEEEEEEEAQPDFRSAIEESYNHVESEWNKRRQNKKAAPQKNEEEEVEDEEENDMNVSQDIYEEIDEDEEEEEEKAPVIQLKPKKVELKNKPIINLSGQRKNPFKVNAPKASLPVRGSSIFDGLKKPERTKSLPAKIIPGKILTKKKPSQSKLAQKKMNIAQQSASSGPAQDGEKKKSAFDLWLDENREGLTEEHPDKSEEELTKVALQAFRQIPKEEKKAWMEKSKGVSNENVPTPSAAEEKDSTPDTDEKDTKKRKREDEAEEIETAAAKKKSSKGFLDGLGKKKPLSQSTNSKLASFAFNKE